MLSNSESSGFCNVGWLNYLLFVGNRSCTDLTKKVINGRRGEWGLWSCWSTRRQEKLGLSWGRTRPLRSVPIILVSTRNFCECIIQFCVREDCMHLISYSEVLIDLVLWMVCVFSLEGYVASDDECCIFVWQWLSSSVNIVLPTMSVQEHHGNEKSCVWHAADFADGELKDETFCIRFASVESKLFYLILVVIAFWKELKNMANLWLLLSLVTNFKHI